MTGAEINENTNWSGYHYLAAAVVLSVIVWIVSHNFVVNENKQKFDDTAVQAQQIAVFFERHVLGIFQYGDSYLKLVRREYQRHYDVERVKELMQEVPLNKSIASHITILDEQGTPLLVSGHQIKPGTTAKDRDYFVFQKNADQDELLVSRVHKGRNSGKLIVRLVRRFEQVGGGFGGVIFLALEAKHITEFFNTMKVGPQSTATLVGTDQYIRARSSWGKLEPGANISVSALWGKLEQSPAGTFRQTAINDDIDRYYSYRRVADFPLVVAIGLSVEDFKRALAVSEFNHYSIAALTTLLIVLTALFFERQQHLLTQIEAKNIELERRADEIEAKNAELSDQNDELERFNYTVSHDLKAPLVTIKGFLGLLQRDLKSKDQDAMIRDLAQISDAADKMGQLLNELLELSRIGRQINPPESRDLGDLAREALDRVAMQIEDHGVDIEIAADMPEVTGDPGRLLEVLQNLIDNAIKFMGEQPAPRIEICAGVDNGEVHCSVKDNGIGIDPKYHERVFELFDRLNPKIDGTGVGLALVKRIVEVHDGRIWVESKGEGQGSTFHFTLPQVLA